MSKPLKVLFAVDFKPGSEHAMHDLLQVARYLPLEITLLHVFNERIFEERENLFPETALKLDSIKEELKQKLEDKLDDWASKVMGQSFYQARIEFGHPEEVFLKQSKGFDCLVIGLNKHGLLDRIFMNSVAEKILGHTFLPTMILRNKLAGCGEANVLLDLTEDVKSVLPSIFDWATKMRIPRLNFISYYPYPLEVVSDAFSASISLPPASDVKDLLEELKLGTIKLLSDFNGDIEFDVTIKKVPAASIASDIAHDLKDVNEPVVIARKRRSYLSEFFLGSVALNLVRSTKADLIILPFKD